MMTMKNPFMPDKTFYFFKKFLKTRLKIKKKKNNSIK